MLHDALLGAAILWGILGAAAFLFFVSMLAARIDRMANTKVKLGLSAGLFTVLGAGYGILIGLI